MGLLKKCEVLLLEGHEYDMYKPVDRITEANVPSHCYGVGILACWAKQFCNSYNRKRDEKGQSRIPFIWDNAPRCKINLKHGELAEPDDPRAGTRSYRELVAELEEAARKRAAQVCDLCEDCRGKTVTIRWVEYVDPDPSRHRNPPKPQERWFQEYDCKTKTAGPKKEVPKGSSRTFDASAGSSTHGSPVFPAAGLP